MEDEKIVDEDGEHHWESVALEKHETLQEDYNVRVGELSKLREQCFMGRGYPSEMMITLHPFVLVWSVMVC